MRIALCVPAYYPARDYGGPVAKVAALAGALTTRGHEVNVWCADFGEGRTRVPPGSRLVDGVAVHYLRRTANYRWTPVVPQAALAIARTPIDVLHCFGIRDGLTIPAAAGARARGIPYIVEPVGMVKARLRNVALKRAVDRLVTDRHLRRAAAVIAGSELEAAEIRAALPDLEVSVRVNPLTLPDPVPPEPTLRARLAIPPGDLLCVTVGRVSVTKGLDLLAQAVAKTDAVSVIAVGPDDADGAAADLARAVEAHALGARFQRLGPAYRDALHSLMASADVLVLPSRTESFGNAAAEASALGLPVLVTSACGIARIVEELDLGLVVAPTVDGLAHGLHSMQDHDTRVRYSRNAPAIRKVVDPDAVAAVQEGIYERAVAGARGRGAA